MLTSKAFSDIITFSRSSNATRIGPTGLVEYAPHNLVQRSQEFENAYWTKGNASITANAVAAPDGTITADKVVENTASDAHIVYQGFTASAITYTFSVYIKAGERSWAIMRLDTGVNELVSFNLSNGTIGTVAAGYTAAITAAGNGWYRCSVTRTLTAATWYTVVSVSNADNVQSYTGDGTSGIYLWGAQLSVGPYPLDYTPTTSAAVYGPRFDYDPVTLAARGLLVEESRTNLLRYSEQFDNAAWGTQQTSISANSGIAPDGTNNADKLIADTSNASHSLFQLVNGTADVYHTFSCYVKKAGHRYAGLYVDTGGGNLGGIIIDLDTGLSSATAASGQGVYLSSSVQALSNGWYRLILTGKFTSTNAYYFHIDLTNGFSFNAFSGNNTDGILIWGAQAEAGSFATSYIPTLASSVTRSADVASVNTLSPWHNSVEGTLYAEGNFIDPASSTSKGIATLVDNSAGNDSISIFGISSSNVKQEVLVGGASQASFTLGYSSNVKAATVYKANDTNAAVNGTTGTTDTSCTVPTVAKLQLGGIYNGTSFQLNGWLRRVAFYPRRLLDAEIQALTS